MVKEEFVKMSNYELINEFENRCKSYNNYLSDDGEYGHGWASIHCDTSIVEDAILARLNAIPNITELSLVIGYAKGEMQTLGELTDDTIQLLEKTVAELFERNEFKNQIFFELSEILYNPERTDGVNYEMGTDTLEEEFLPMAIDFLMSG